MEGTPGKQHKRVVARGRDGVDVGWSWQEGEGQSIYSWEQKQPGNQEESQHV